MKRGALLWVVTAGVVEYSPVGALFSCFLFHYFHDALLSNYGQDRYNELPVQKVNITIVSCKILSLLTQLPTTILYNKCFHFSFQRRSVDLVPQQVTRLRQTPTRGVHSGITEVPDTDYCTTIISTDAPTVWQSTSKNSLCRQRRGVVVYSE